MYWCRYTKIRNLKKKVETKKMFFLCLFLFGMYAYHFEHVFYVKIYGSNFFVVGEDVRKTFPYFSRFDISFVLLYYIYLF